MADDARFWLADDCDCAECRDDDGWCEGDDGVCDDPDCCGPDDDAGHGDNWARIATMTAFQERGLL